MPEPGEAQAEAIRVAFHAAKVATPSAATPTNPSENAKDQIKNGASHANKARQANTNTHRKQRRH